MATVYRKTYTQPLPKNVQIVERSGRKMALWLDGRGKKHFDQITTGKKGQTKIVRYCPTYLAQYRSACGEVVIESTGCRDEQAARHVLAELVKRQEHIRAGILTSSQCRTADHAKSSLEEHIAGYIEHLHAKTKG